MTTPREFSGCNETEQAACCAAFAADDAADDARRAVQNCTDSDHEDFRFFSSQWVEAAEECRKAAKTFAAAAEACDRAARATAQA